MPITMKMLPAIIDAAAREGAPVAAAGAEGENQEALAKLKAYLQQQQEQKDVAATQNLESQYMQNHPGFHGTFRVGPNGAEISENQQYPIGVLGLQLRKQALQDKQEQAYSKAEQPFSDVGGAMQQLEAVTNRDGKGGIFTNPNATLMSAGKVESAVPDSLLGLGEMIGTVPKGTMEERKAIDRVKLSLGHAMTGSRMNPQMQKQIQESIGQLNSGDPQLMAKGLRGAGRIVGGQVQNARSGFTPEVTSDVDARNGGNPMDFYGGIVNDNPQVKQPLQSPVQPKQPTPPTDGFDPAWLK